MTDLSPRELELAQLVAAGYSNAEIALKLQIAHQTVKNHVRSAYVKLGVHSRLHLALKLAELSVRPGQQQPTGLTDQTSSAPLSPPQASSLSDNRSVL